MYDMRDNINKHKERLKKCTSFEEFVDALNLTKVYYEAGWLRRDWQCLQTHGEVFAKSLLMPTAKSFDMIFTHLTIEKDTHESFVEREGAETKTRRYVCYKGSQNLLNEPDDGKFYTSYCSLTQAFKEIFEAVVGDVNTTYGNGLTSIEIIEWPETKQHLVVANFGRICGKEWIAVI